MNTSGTPMKKERSRESEIAAVSALGIVINLLIAGMRIVTGLLTSSIAILSEGVNNAMDALTSVLTLTGTKLSAKHPDAKHPFGYGRIEYLTSLTVSILILITGTQMLSESVKLVFHPVEMSISAIALIIVAASAVAKFFLGTYTIRIGQRTGSKALEGIGLEGRNDAFASVLTLASAAVFLLFHFSIDAYVGIFMALLILKAGFEVLKDTVSELLGRPGQKELADELYRKIRRFPGVLGAADMMLHNYGPEAWSGSVNVEIDHRKNIGEIYESLHQLQLQIMHEYHVTMVFGIYAVDRDSEKGKALRGAIAAFVRETEHVTSFHALYLDQEHKKLYCDLIVDYKLRDWDKVRSAFLERMKEILPGYEVELTVETEYV